MRELFESGQVNSEREHSSPFTRINPFGINEGLSTVVAEEVPYL
jgi:hypothetical protein